MTAVIATIHKLAYLWSNAQGCAPSFVVVPDSEREALVAELVADRCIVTSDGLLADALEGEVTIAGVRVVFGPGWGAGMDFPPDMLGASPDAGLRIVLPH